MNSPSLKILVCCHKPTALPCLDGDRGRDIYVPIHCGRADADGDNLLRSEDARWMQEHCIGDDTGVNISAQHSNFSELSAIFWAWKNYDKLGNPDYIGFIHYRRGFLPSVPCTGGIIVPYKKPCTELHFLMNDLSNLHLGDYALYAPEPVQAYRLKLGEGRYTWTKFPPEPCRVIEKNPGNIGLSEALQYLDTHYPERSRYAQEYLQGTRAYQWNMAIWRRDFFEKYAVYLFDVLQYVKKSIDFSSFNTADKRFCGYLGEHLTAIFIHEQVSTGVRVRHLPTFFLGSTAPDVCPENEYKFISSAIRWLRILRYRLNSVLFRGGWRMRYEQQVARMRCNQAWQRAQTT